MIPMLRTRDTIAGILDFCFVEGPASRWFVKDAAFDAEVHARFADLHEAAVAGDFDHWQDTAEGCVALCVLLDQAPRNLFRYDPRSFASDAAARAVTRHALERKLDRDLSQEQRGFLYLPLEHSENLADQEESVRLFTGLAENPEGLDYAVRHHDIIARFGRFPHRNAILGRANTPEETEFLTQPGSSF
jgi:uncharacterized protein (DUF924 family)